MSTASDYPVLVNPIKQRMLDGDVALGISVRMVRSVDIVGIAEATGHDFLFIDVQHSVFTVETIATLGLTAQAAGLAAIVRVRGVGDPDVSLLLDNGVSGIVFPNVATAAEAQAAVESARFPPLGRRTVTGTYPHYGYRSVPLHHAIPAMDAATLVVVMIESPEGLDNVEAIAAVDGVDVVLIGTNDMLFAMGKPGQFDDPEIQLAIDRTIAAATAHGKFAGCGGNRDVARQVDVLKRGVRFLTTQTDIGFLAAGARRWVDGLREGWQPAGDR
jgi:2-keto-3-deoxy-L-rhamnonate aldolase RhmA